jgi:hypothetical protein
MEKFTNDADAYIDLLGQDSVLYVNFKPQVAESYFSVIQQNGIEQKFRKSHMLWKTPSEHTINNR